MKGIYLDVIIADEIRYMIESNLYKQGEKIPSEADLCKKYNVQKMTIRSSLQILKDEGWIVTKKNSGHYVGKRRIKKNLRYLSSTSELLERMDMSNETRLVSFDRIVVNKELNEKMGINIGHDLYKLVRIRIVEKIPIALEISYIVPDYFENLEQFDFSQKSLYEVFSKEYNIDIDRSESQLDVIYTNKSLATYLQVNENSPLILEKSLIYDFENRLIEYSEDFMRIEQYVFVR